MEPMGRPFLSVAAEDGYPHAPELPLNKGLVVLHGRYCYHLGFRVVRGFRLQRICLVAFFEGL